jgi:hypothetical protein
MMSKFLNPFIYHAIAQHSARWPSVPVYAEETYAQCSEDLIVGALLRALMVRENKELRNFQYLEIGGNHPISCSMTWLLHERFGMNGVIVEASPQLIGELKRLRPDDRILQYAVTPDLDADYVPFYVATDDELSSLDRTFVEDWPGWKVDVADCVRVPAIGINKLLEMEFGPEAPLFMSIDIEGLDVEVLKTMDFSRWRPAIISAEPSEHYKPGSTRELIDHFHAKGYIVMAVTDVNLIAMDVACCSPR